MRKFNNMFYDLSAKFNRIINLSEGISHTMQQIDIYFIDIETPNAIITV